MIEVQEENEFVDYYALLEVPADADERELRRRIFALYDEARQNLDHRSHRKRFYYVSLYETHLARARHFLLDAERRPRYDSCLRAFQAGQPFDYRALFEKTIAAQAVKAPAAAPQRVPAPEAPVAPVPTESGVQPRPAQPGAEAAPPGAGTPDLAPPAAPPPSATAAAPPTAAGAPTAAGTQTAAGAPGATPVAATSAAATPVAASPVAATPQSAVQTGAAPAAPELSESAARLEKLLRTPTLDPAQAGRRRDFQRRELIGGELKAQGRFAFLITVSITLLLGTMVLWQIESSLINTQDGTLSAADVILVLLALIVLCGLSCLAGWYASRLTRRQIIAKLSRMSYDELLRHCRA